MKIRIQALKIRIQTLKIRIQALKIRIQALKIRIQAFEIRIQAFKIQIQAFKIRIQAFKTVADTLFLQVKIIPPLRNTVFHGSKDDSYWTSRKNSIELIELPSTNKVNLV